ncbi:MAG: hypothetical protein ACLUOK_02190 [Parabacteroides distasonis]
MRRSKVVSQEVFEYHGTNTIRFKMQGLGYGLTRANKGKAFFVTIATKDG